MINLIPKCIHISRMPLLSVQSTRAFQYDFAHPVLRLRLSTLQGCCTLPKLTYRLRGSVPTHQQQPNNVSSYVDAASIARGAPYSMMAPCIILPWQCTGRRSQLQGTQQHTVSQ